MFANITKFLLIALFCYRCSSAEIINSRFEPRYHAHPPYGWMNDPNGFSFLNNEYHLFYQFNPNSSQEPGIAHWGHLTSPNLVDWLHQSIAMYPDQSYDKDGVFSGSALIDNGTMYIYYTGNVNHPGENPDHTQKQAVAVSLDGYNVTKYEGNPIIEGEEYQPNIRDPKVWKQGTGYRMVLGNSFNNNTLGRALLFSSEDMISWKKISVLGESNGTLGYMWECPDFFKLRNKHVLLFSPQGMKPQGDKYRNEYQTGYIIGRFDDGNNQFKPECEFEELDHGHDFYATQTTLDKSNNRVVIAWLDMWDQNYPERNDGFTGQMTIPRILSLGKDGCSLLQKPVSQLRDARGETLRSGKGLSGDSVQLPDKAGEIRIRAGMRRDFELLIQSENASVSLKYDSRRRKVTLDRGGEDGIRRTDWRPRGLISWQVFVDASSIELFCGRGEVTFSSRYFPYGAVNVTLGAHTRAYEFTVYEIKRTIQVANG